MTKDAAIALVGDIVIELKESADECLQSQRDGLTFGKLLGYSEALSSIKRAFDSDPYISKMLDFDIDQRYLTK